MGIGCVVGAWRSTVSSRRSISRKGSVRIVSHLQIGGPGCRAGPGRYPAGTVRVLSLLLGAPGRSGRDVGASQTDADSSPFPAPTLAGRPVWATWILRGLASSATGMVSVSTPSA